MSISINQVNYVHPDKEVLFQNISFSINRGEKVSLIGNNGCGKSTLLRIIAREFLPASGQIVCSELPYYVPQHFGQYDHQTVAQALKADTRINALHAIIRGDASNENFTLLNDDWEIEERCLAALSTWALEHVSLNQVLGTLSGGEKTKVFLAGLAIHHPGIILMDEPTNHLDRQSREQLYHFINNSTACILIVSHDRELLSILNQTLEMTPWGITAYGGNYEFYKFQKEQLTNALQMQLNEKEKTLRLAKKVAREAAERKQKHDVRGKKQNEKKSMSRMAMNTLKDKAEKSTVKLNEIHNNKMNVLSDSLSQIRNSIDSVPIMKLDFDSSTLHKGKILIDITNVHFTYDNKKELWKTPVTCQIRTGERITLKGGNGSGKTTLLKLILGSIEPTSGTITRADFSSVYIDQEYSLIHPSLTVLQQVEQFNSRLLPGHEIKTILNRYLFPKDIWDKKCEKLSGGEKMRLVFCCLMVSNNVPDLFVLDEPTNNLDIQNIGIITKAVKEYQGTLLVVSHDKHFIEEIGIEKIIEL